MKKIYTNIFLFVICLPIFSVTAKSQGFDWQYSSRLPTDYPYLYIGVNANISYLMHYGYINLAEGYAPCCTFENGTGIGSNLGVSAEFWKGLFAYYGEIDWASFPGNFTAPGITLARKLDDGTVYNVVYQNEFKSSFSYLFAEFGAKYRLLASHFNVGLGLKIGILLSHSEQQIERIVSPAEERFADGSQSQVLYNSKISDIKSYVFTPRLKAGYDLNLGLGMYATPSVSLGLPLLNIAKSAQWQTWSFTFGITVFKDILKN